MDADQPNSQQLNPAALTAAEAARLLTAAGGRPVGVEVVQAAIDAGAPLLADGRLNLVELMAWLEKDLAVKP
jgi:predicted glycosyltransferase